MNNQDSSIETVFAKMENFVSTKTVVGEAITVGNVVLLPLIDVSFGVGAGSGNANRSDKPGNDSAGAVGLGAKITPSAVIVVTDGTVQLVNVKNQESVNKLIDMVPGILSKLNLGDLVKKAKPEKDATTTEDSTLEI